MCYEALWFPEVESSRTQFDVLDFGRKACKSSKMPCRRLEGSTIFWLAENLPRSWALLEHARELANFRAKIFFLYADRPNFAENLRLFEQRPFFFTRALSRYVFGSSASTGSVLGRCVLGLEFFLCSWPRALCPRLYLWWFHNENWGVELTSCCFIFMYLQKTIRENIQPTTEE